MGQRKAEWRGETRVCRGCGCDFTPNFRTQSYHSLSCAAETGRTARQKQAREREYVIVHGYRMISLGNGKRAPEHRVVYEQSRGVKLQPWHYIEWIDGNKLNCDPANLRLRNTLLEEYVRTTGTLPAQMGRTICPKHLTRNTDAAPGPGRDYLTCAECRRERHREHRKKLREAQQ
jgi:hypothetical protein